MSSSFVPIRRKSVDDGEQEVESTRVIIHDGYNLGGWLVPILSIFHVADYPALSVNRAGGGNPLYAEDTPNQEFLIWCAPIQEFLNWCVTNQDQSL